MNMKDLKKNEEAVVTAMHLDDEICKRLQSLGMLIGTPIKVLQRKPSGTMVILLRANRFALGANLASGIEVEKVA